MAKYSSFLCFEDAEVTRTKNNRYKVYLIEEEMEIIIGDNLVKEIALATSEEENLIAILLSYIDFVRRSRITQTVTAPRKVKEEVLITSLIKLLRENPIERLINIVKYLKWHQLLDVLTSEEPSEKIQEL